MPKLVSYVNPFNVPIILNHCVLSYPTDIENANIGMIEDLCNSYPENIIYKTCVDGQCCFSSYKIFKWHVLLKTNKCNAWGVC